VHFQVASASTASALRGCSLSAAFERCKADDVPGDREKRALGRVQGWSNGHRSCLLRRITPTVGVGEPSEASMFNRLSMSALLFSLAAACDRSPAPSPEKTVPDQLVPNYQAATPAGSAADGNSATRGNSAANDASATNGNSASADPTRGVLTNPESEKLSDAQIARITNSVNAAEIEQGKLARSKATDARVKQFAERMVKHHSQAKDKQAKLELDSAESALSTKLEHDASTTLGALRANADASFDQEYMGAQVKEHQRVLDTIDQELLPNAKNDKLEAYLKEVRSTVESHLKDARDLEAKLTQRGAAPR
jgi:putative membrane protein